MSRLTQLNYYVPFWAYHNKYRFADELASTPTERERILFVLYELINITGRLTCPDSTDSSK